MRKFHARSEGVDLGCRLLTVNGQQAWELFDGHELCLETLPPPFVLRFRQSGPKLLCHAGCGVVCGDGHEMTAQRHCLEPGSS